MSSNLKGTKGMQSAKLPNLSFERDRLPALPAGTLRAFGAPAAPQLKRSTSKAMRHLLAILALAAVSAHAANPQQFEATCGATTFRVTAVNNGHPLDNTFSLSALTTSGARELFKGEEGGWFHAACLPAKDGKPLLVFQSYCGGSACVEGKYGAIEPATLKLLLRPSSKNVENHKQLSALLGTSAPHLGNLKGAFCCGE